MTYQKPARPNAAPMQIGYNGPIWQPQDGELMLAPALSKKKLEALCAKNPGSLMVEALEGELCEVIAYGRKVYAIQIADGEKPLKLPEHGAIYPLLRQLRQRGWSATTKKPDAAARGARIYVEFKGKADKGKPGQTAPFVYDVIPHDQADVLGEGPWSLTLVRKDDRDDAGASDGARDPGPEPDHVKG